MSLVNDVQTDKQTDKPTAGKRKERNDKPGMDLRCIIEREETKKERKKEKKKKERNDKLMKEIYCTIVNK
jgi:hypothetical protein